MRCMISESVGQLDASILSLLKRGRLPHALLFSSSSDEAGEHLVNRLAAAILCQEWNSQELSGCNQCTECKMLKSNNHPDFVRINCSEKTEASAENIRSLLGRLALKSYRGGARVVVFSSTEELGISAANILLKSLEEPSANTYFILLTKNASRLLPTVLSRCQRWFVPAPEQEYAADKDRWGLADKVQRMLSGDSESQIFLATIIHKEKEEAPVIKQLIRALFRKELIKNNENDALRCQLAQLILNFLEAEYFVEERNSNSQYIFNYVFTSESFDPLKEFLV